MEKKKKKSMLQKNNINFLHTSSEEEKNIPTCQFKGTSRLRSLSDERMTVLLCYLTFLPQAAAKKCISFQRKASSFKDYEYGGKSQRPIPSERSSDSGGNPLIGIS